MPHDDSPYGTVARVEQDVPRIRPGALHGAALALEARLVSAILLDRRVTSSRSRQKPVRMHCPRPAPIARYMRGLLFLVGLAVLGLIVLGDSRLIDFSRNVF